MEIGGQDINIPNFNTNDEFPLQIETSVIEAKERKLKANWTLEVVQGYDVKNQDFKVGDTLYDEYGNSYGVILEKSSDHASANYALLNKQPGRGWVITMASGVDLNDLLVLDMFS